MESSQSSASNGSGIGLQNIFGSIAASGGVQTGNGGAMPVAMNVQNLFGYGQSGGSEMPYGRGPMYGVEGMSSSGPSASVKTPFGGANMFGASYGVSLAPGSPSSAAPKKQLDLFNTSAIPSASSVAQSHLSSVPVYGPGTSGLMPTLSQAKQGASAMPALPPVASNVPTFSAFSGPPSSSPNNIHHPSVSPSELKTRLLALSPAQSPADVSMLTLRRPVELPESEYRRDSMSADKTNCAYVTNLKNVGAAIRVWRDATGSQTFLKNPPVSLKEFIGNPTDMHITSTPNDDAYIAVGDTTGNVSIHLIPGQNSNAAQFLTSTTSSDSKYCILRITPSSGSPPVKVLRVTWHSMLPQVLAIAYSDGFVSVWNIGQIITAMQSNMPLPASDLLLSTAYPITYARPFQSQIPVVLSLSHGSETITDVVMWGTTVFSAASSGTIYMHDVNTGHVQRYFKAHQHGVGAIVLATCPSVESGYMPLFATTSGDGSEIKLWRHASPLADWVCLQSLSLPVETTPYILSRYTFGGIFFLFNPVAGSAWELKLFEDEFALLPGNYFASMRCNYALMLAPYEIILKYTKEGIAIMTFPKTTYSRENLKIDPSAQHTTLTATLPVYAATLPAASPSQPATPQRAVEYLQSHRENSFSANPLSNFLQTVVPPSRTPNQADALPVLPPRPSSQGLQQSTQPTQLQGASLRPSTATPPVPHSETHSHQPSGAERVFGSNTSTVYSITASSLSTSQIPPSTASSTSSAASSMPVSTITAVQAILDEASRDLGEMIKLEEEKWRNEDKMFMLKVNEAMRLIPTGVAERIQSECQRLPPVAVDVPELARSLSAALATPIGLAFREQFGDVLVPAMEDATAKMLKTLDTKMKTVATQHAQSIATNDIARSVEPLVASLMHATAEMTKSINTLRPLNAVIAASTPSLPAEPVLKFPSAQYPQNTLSAMQTTGTPNQALSQTPVQAQNTSQTPQKPRSGSSGASSAPSTASPAPKGKNNPIPADAKQANPTNAKATNKKDKKDAIPKKDATASSSSASSSEAASASTQTASNSNPTTNSETSPATTYPASYWLFALAHGIHLS
jgi:hypothetical protein